MINIETKHNLILCAIIILIIILLVIGVLCCEHKDKRMIETRKTAYEAKDDTKITIEIKTDKDGDTNQAVPPVSLGEFKLTAYCSCKICCGKWANNRPLDENGNEIVYGSIGERLKSGYSIAVDPSVIPYNSKVIINGKIYEAQDCGGAIKGNRIDVYHDSHSDALNFGVQYAEIFLVRE